MRKWSAKETSKEIHILAILLEGWGPETYPLTPPGASAVDIFLQVKLTDLNRAPSFGRRGLLMMSGVEKELLWEENTEGHNNPQLRDSSLTGEEIPEQNSRAELQIRLPVWEPTPDTQFLTSRWTLPTAFFSSTATQPDCAPKAYQFRWF